MSTIKALELQIIPKCHGYLTGQTQSYHWLLHSPCCSDDGGSDSSGTDGEPIVAPTLLKEHVSNRADKVMMSRWGVYILVDLQQAISILVYLF